MPYKNPEKQKESQHAYYVNNKHKVIESTKNRRSTNLKYVEDLKANGCSLCGYSKCNSALEFHHLDPKVKDKNISIAVKTCGLERLKKEISKCILVCSNCHKEIHAGLMEQVYIELLKSSE